MSIEHDKNETVRFVGDGVCFKAKLIGILEVPEARGDRMCQDALNDLKIAIRAAGEHKQRITINIAIDGLRLRDEKTGDSLYHHPVHKISFIAQDMSDSRAFGYIFGSPDTGHRFFGIKTDKAASQVVIAMRDLFQVVFAIKKKEMEMAKKFASSPIYSDRSLSNSKSSSPEPNKNANLDTKGGACGSEIRPTPAVADLVDLELELNSLQQGLTQMERITPSDPFGPKDDPFGDSFTSYPQKPILPPPPSGRERANRSSESSSLFSPKTGADSTSANDLFGSRNLGTPKEFTFNEFNSSHDEPSSGDWFTPSGGNSLFEDAPPPTTEQQPSKDQHETVKQEIMSQFDVFTELDPLGTKTMNPELGTGKIKPYVDKKHFFQELKNPPKKVLNDLVSDKPQEASLFPATFDQSINKSTNSVSSGDPFGEDPFGQTDPFAEADFNKQDVFDEFSDFKVNNVPTEPVKINTDLFTPMSKSPKTPSFLEKQMSLAGTSPRNNLFSKQNTFDSPFDYKKNLSKLYENPSLDLSSESECAPDPPPRPSNTLPQIKPPPLPPKKQVLGDIAAKPPPRPPHTEESHYDYIEKYETNYVVADPKSPPIPAPARKSKFESEPDEEDYLTPITFPTVDIKTKAAPLLLPPPLKANKKKPLEPPPPAEVSNISNLSLDGLDITLSQLTLSGLNELANKLQIPASQLSNMTLAQLTTYLSNFIKNSTKPEPETTSKDAENFASFANDDFADFNHFNNTPPVNNETYDRYAAFRELLQEEIKQTKIDTEPEEIAETKQPEEKVIELKEEDISQDVEIVDRYAALRDIDTTELKSTENKVNEELEEEDDYDYYDYDDDHLETIDEVITEQNNLNDDFNIEMKSELSITDLKIIDDAKIDNEKPTPTEVIEDYTNNVFSEAKVITPESPKVHITEPIPIEETQCQNVRLNSGSLSDVVSGSSPEIDLTGGSENAKKTDTAESWAIFDRPVIAAESKDTKAVQSEEGVSPWSSDSKEFGNGSPPEWRQRIDSESGGDQWNGADKRKEHESGWWDTSAEPEVQYYQANRRSTDSYEDERYDCYERPRRRRQTTWSGQATGGHSSSSRDVSPWEEEPRRRDGRQSSWSSRHSRQHSFDRHSRRPTDSWDEEDDYEYEDEHSSRFHWPERHGSREADRDRHTMPPAREVDRSGRDLEEWDDRRMQHRRRRDADRDRWCCPDYDMPDQEKPRYGSGRWSNPERRKHDERYYSRDQESPWEDEYSAEVEDPPQPHYLTARRTRIRPSSASEMDRKTGEIKTRPGQYYYGGSDGERDRRYKTSRRSKSRDSQYVERHKLEMTSRTQHRLKQHQHQKFENDFSQDMPSKKLDASKEVMKKPPNPQRGKKLKESPKSEEAATFPRKSTHRSQSLFENDFVPEPEVQAPAPRFNFENEFETSEAESPTPKPLITKTKKKNWFDADRRPKSNQKVARYKQKSLFEDDFSPTDKADSEIAEIPSIKEEHTEDDVVPKEMTSMARKRMLKMGKSSDHIKKSESVNIFARENDPFDDDFFSVGGGSNGESSGDIKWTEQFNDFDIQRAK
ncbi:PREDICTED: protein disabled isoform X2 [Nicrophorus vespilloides]|uniref:Protein disabled isoform X2 n=1 Tax=Nicrophorus vespilloides TaxID=110193 RepID=A0ABM1MST2_NICVS|nr:PREDICTED: protein disabled isoform X2 [Nicrophorus vespilloides]